MRIILATILQILLSLKLSMEIKKKKLQFLRILPSAAQLIWCIRKSKIIYAVYFHWFNAKTFYNAGVIIVGYNSTKNSNNKYFVIILLLFFDQSIIAIQKFV